MSFRLLAQYEPSFQTSVKRHIDQTVRTRQFRAQSETVERRAVTKSQKGRQASVERKAGECFQWKAIGPCSKGDSCSFSHGLASGNRRDQRQEAQSSSLAPKVQTQTDGKKPSKVSSRREGVRTRQSIIGTLPCVSFTSLNQDALMAKNADSDTLRLMGSPSKKSKKNDVKLYNWVVCLKIPIRASLFYGITPSNSSRARGTTSKIREIKIPSRGVFLKV